MSELPQRLKALADPNRIKMIRLLRHDLCVRALSERLGISEAATSQHLKILRENGFVRGEKRSYWTHYAIKPEAFEQLANDIIDLAQEGPATTAHRCQREDGNCPGERSTTAIEGLARSKSNEAIR